MSSEEIKQLVFLNSDGTVHHRASYVVRHKQRPDTVIKFGRSQAALGMDSISAAAHQSRPLAKPEGVRLEIRSLQRELKVARKKVDDIEVKLARAKAANHPPESA